MINKKILHGDDSIQIERVLKYIFNGALDYSKQEKVTYSILSFLFAYFSLESCRVYYTLGTGGTNTLPIGKFSYTFGGYSTLTNRKAYYHYQMFKKLGRSKSNKKIAAKNIIAIFIAAISGTVMALIAKKESTYNRVVTGAVHTLLNFLSTVALMSIIYRLGFLLIVKNKCTTI